ncbi:hypothetical protein Tco_0382135 [Tanacetum coccineum]
MTFTITMWTTGISLESPDVWSLASDLAVSFPIAALDVLTTRPSLEALLSQRAASGSKSHVPDTRSESGYPTTVAVSDVSEAHNGPLDSILSHEPKPLGKHKPPPL